jgi:hypothetical protein
MDDLKEALDTIQYLRAQLHIAYFDRTQTSKTEVNKVMKDSRKVLLKHGVPDELDDADAE